MYLSSSIAQAYRWLRASTFGRRADGRRAPSQVIHLGVTSLLTDVSSEMVDTILPLYARYVLDFSPLGIGALDGGYHAAAAAGRVVLGALADRTRRWKELAFVGYALSLVARVLLAVSGLGAGGGAARGEQAIVGAVAMDRAGKGLRAAPRDALIAIAAPADDRATAFAVHRALDTLGSVAGPLVGFVLLTLVPMGFDVVFVASAGIGLLGLAYFALFVRAPGDATSSLAGPLDSSRAAPHDSSLAAPRPGPPPAKRGEGAERLPTFSLLVVIGMLVGVSEISPGILYLVVGSRAGLAASSVGLLHVAASLACVAFVIPFGRAADRVGAGRVLLLGQLALVGAYAWILAPLPGVVTGIGCALLIGAHYAATEGVLVALATLALPRERMATGLAVLSAAAVVAKIGSSVGFGALWDRYGTTTAIAAATGVAAVAAVMIAIAIRRRR